MRARRNVRATGLIELLFSGACVAVGSMSVRDACKVDVDRNREMIKKCESTTYGLGIMGLVSLGLYGVGRYGGESR